MKWQDGEGISVFLKPSGYTGTTPRGGEVGSNGLTLDAARRLVLCQHGDRRIVRREADGRWTTLVDRYEGKRLSSPNDLVFKSNGDLYFTDPPYGLPQGANDPTRELDFCGVFRVSAADGKVTLLTKEMTRPNGIAFSPDEKILYVSQSDPQKAVWMAFAVKEDGTLGPGRVFYDATRWTKTLKGLPDGMKIDRARQPVRYRAGRGQRILAGRDAAGPDQSRRAHRQLCLRRRRLRAIHHGPSVSLPDQDQHQRRRVLTPDTRASLGIAWSDDLKTWHWPGEQERGDRSAILGD